MCFFILRIHYTMSICSFPTHLNYCIFAILCLTGENQCVLEAETENHLAWQDLKPAKHSRGAAVANCTRNAGSR